MGRFTERQPGAGPAEVQKLEFKKGKQDFCLHAAGLYSILILLPAAVELSGQLWIGPLGDY